MQQRLVCWLFLCYNGSLLTKAHLLRSGQRELVQHAISHRKRGLTYCLHSSDAGIHGENAVPTGVLRLEQALLGASEAA